MLLQSGKESGKFHQDRRKIGMTGDFPQLNVQSYFNLFAVGSEPGIQIRNLGKLSVCYLSYVQNIFQGKVILTSYLNSILVCNKLVGKSETFFIRIWKKIGIVIEKLYDILN